MTGDRLPTSPHWQWRTFPVFAALVVGLAIGSFVDGRPDTDLGVVVRVIALAGFAYVLIHLFVMNVIVAGRIKRRQRKIDAVGDEYEDVVVHPNDEV